MKLINKDNFKFKIAVVIIFLIYYCISDDSTLILNEFMEDSYKYIAVLITFIITVSGFYLVRIKVSFREFFQKKDNLSVFWFVVIAMIITTYLMCQAVVKNSVPRLYTQWFGHQGELSVKLKKHYYTGSRGCPVSVYLDDGSYFVECIANNEIKYPDKPFQAKLIGKQSKLGFLIESIEVAEKP